MKIFSHEVKNTKLAFIPPSRWSINSEKATSSQVSQEDKVNYENYCGLTFLYFIPLFPGDKNETFVYDQKKTLKSELFAKLCPTLL